MRLLYATGRYSPLKHDAGSGEDYNLYNAFEREGFDIRIVGPLEDRADLLERVYRKAHGLLSSKRYAKYSGALLRSAAREVATATREYLPDALFSHNLSAFVRLETDIPIVYLMDSTLLGTEAQWPQFSKLECKRMIGWEKAVLAKSTRIITRSQWAIDTLVNQYDVPPEKIELVQAASSLPERVIASSVETSTSDLSTVRLLLVGRVYRLKGIDIAIDVVNQLNQQGVPAELRIVGLAGEDSEHVRFMGAFRKSIESELQAYAAQYAWAHFLIHPARYDSAPIVTAEAAAFGLPTLTNAAGGIATTVQDRVSGVVLPHLSPAGDYVKVIRHYRDNPLEYTALRQSTHERYQRELNWNVVGHRISEIIREVVEADRIKKGRSKNI